MAVEMSNVVTEMRQDMTDEHSKAVCHAPLFDGEHKNEKRDLL